MNKLEIAKRLDFKYDEINKIYTKRFRGFRIDYYLDTDKFYLSAKETDSSGDILRGCSFEECSKPVKKIWLLINTLVELHKNELENQNERMTGYYSQVQILLFRMHIANTTDIADDGRSSGSMYNLAETYYKRVNSLKKWF